MKNKCLLILPTILFLTCLPAKAQIFEIQQLVLNIQKLNQLKSILNQMYDGYKILTTGYNTIKDLSEGNFNIHRAFLDGLLTVSPTVKKYKKIVDIINLQQKILHDSKDSLANFKSKELFSKSETSYMEKVYSDLIDRSVKNLEELLMIVTDNELRMNDAERLASIDRIYDDLKEKGDFLRYFNKKSTLFYNQRAKTIGEIQSLEKFNEK